MSELNIRNLTFAHDGAERLFDGLSLQLDTGWRLGLIGRNGRGKTTLLKLLLQSRGQAGAGSKYEYAGEINSPVDFDYFPYELPGPERPAARALADLFPLELWRLEKELAGLKLDPEVLGRPFLSLSGGERTKVLLAALFTREGRFPLIDEPTNHLDLEGRQVVGRYLSRCPGFILVSHDRAFLDLAVDHVLSLNRGGVELQKGDYSSWLRNREYLDQYEAERRRKLSGDISRLTAAARRSSAWADQGERGKYGAGPVDRGFIGRKAAKVMKRAKAADRRRHEALEEKKSLLGNLETRDRLSIATEAHPSGRLLSFDEVSVSYGGRKVLDRLSFSLEQGQRLLLAGPNGCGKSTVLKLAVGREAPPHEGSVRRASGLEVSWLPQEMDSLGQGELKAWIKREGLDESLFKAILHKLGFDKRQFDTPLADFSLGQKKKILIGACLCRPAHLHVWDEPLNYIDLISRGQIEELILEYRPTMLLVEHDQRFAETVATETLDLGRRA